MKIDLGLEGVAFPEILSEGCPPSMIVPLKQRRRAVFLASKLSRPFKTRFFHLYV